MKKLKVLSLALAAAGMVSLTSCLDGGSNTQSGAAFGVVDMMSGGLVNVAYITDDLPIYSPSFEKLNYNQCVLFSYSIDYGSAANTAGNKYVTAQVAEIVKINTLDVAPYLSDTATFFKNELTFTEVGLTGTGYPVKNRLFIGSINPESAKDQNGYDISYNVNAPVVESGRNVYEIIVRGFKKTVSSSEQGTFAEYNALNVAGFLSQTVQREKAENEKTVQYRFKYINEFNKDTTVAKWKTSDIMTYTIPTSTSN